MYKTGSEEPQGELMNDFFIQTPNNIDIKEIKFPAGIGLPNFRTVDGIEKIHRTITTKTITDWWSEIGQDIPKSDFSGFISDDLRGMIYASCADIKAECLMFDASYLKALGYKVIKFIDLQPGDTSISYEVWGEK